MAIVLFIFASLMFIHIMDFMIIMPLGNVLMDLFHISTQQFSFLVSAYTLAAGTASFTSAFFIDRFDRKKALVFVYTGFTIGTLLCGLSHSFYMLMFARIATGMFGGVINGIIYTIVGDAFPPEKRSSAMGLLMSAFSFAAVIGVPLGLYLANLYTWNFPFYLMAAVAFVVLIMVILFVPNFNSHLSAKKKSPLELIKILLLRRNQQIALIFMLLLVLGQFMLIPFITPYMIRNVGFTQEQIPLIYFVGGGLTMFTGPFVGRMADKFGRKKVFLFMASVSIIPLLILTNLPPIPVYIAIIFTGIFFVFINGRMVPSNSLMTSVVLPENRGGFMSLSSSFQQVGAGLASLISGSIVISAGDGHLLHYEYVGYLAVLLTFVAIFISFKLKTVEGK